VSKNYEIECAIAELEKRFAETNAVKSEEKNSENENHSTSQE